MESENGEPATHDRFCFGVASNGFPQTLLQGIPRLLLTKTSVPIMVVCVEQGVETTRAFHKFSRAGVGPPCVKSEESR